MSDNKSLSIESMPEYQDLVRKRRVICLPLTVVTLVSYFSFILLVAYAPGFLNQTIGDGVTSLGIVFGLGTIVLTLLITLVYVWYANTRLEDLILAIQKKVADHG